MTDEDKNELAQGLPSTTKDAALRILPNGGKSMRRGEVKMSALFALVVSDYVENNKKSLSTLSVHINNHLMPFFGERSAERLRLDRDTRARRSFQSDEHADRHRLQHRVRR